MKRILCVLILSVLLLLPVSAGAEASSHPVELCTTASVLSVNLEYTVTAEAEVAFSVPDGVITAWHYDEENGMLYLGMASANEIPLAEPLAEISGGGEITLTKALINGKAMEVKTSHSWKTVPGNAPTCDKTGLTDGIFCDACGAVLQPQEVIPATGPVITAAADGDVIRITGMLADDADPLGTLWIAVYGENGRMLRLYTEVVYTANALDVEIPSPAGADYVKLFLLSSLLPTRPHVTAEI